VQRGTATVVKQLGVPVAGKTGTTNDEKDAWFVGFTPNLVAGVYLGYDNPQPLNETGGGFAAPVFVEFMKQALAGKPVADFRIPDGMMQIAVNRRTGMATSGDSADSIIEAFKPGTGPSDVYEIIGDGAVAQAPSAPTISQQTEQAIVSGAGGLF